MGSVTINAGSYIPIIVGRDTGIGPSSDSACGYSNRMVIYYDSNYTFAAVPVIWLNANETGVPTAGWYSLDGITKYWNGTAFTTSITCLVAPISLSSGITLVDSCFSVSDTYYIAAGQTFATMTAIYTDTALTTLAPNGYYSNGVNTRLWISPTMGAVVICSSATYNLYNLKTNDISAGTCTSGVTAPVYIISTDTFSTATQIWNNSDGTGVPPIGYYSYGSEVRYWNGIELDVVETCPTATTSIFLTFGFTAEASCLNYTENEYWFPTADLDWSTASSIGTISTYLVTPVAFPISGFYTDSLGVVRQWDSVTRSFLSTDSCPPMYYYEASAFTCPPICGFISTGWIISSTTPLVGGKYYVGSGIVLLCGTETTRQYSITIIENPFDSCSLASCLTPVPNSTWDVSTLSDPTHLTACGYTLDQNLYSDPVPLSSVITLYINPELTIPFVGDNNKYHIREGASTYTTNINGTGNLLGLTTC